MGAYWELNEFEYPATAWSDGYAAGTLAWLTEECPIEEGPIEADPRMHDPVFAAWRSGYLAGAQWRRDQGFEI